MASTIIPIGARKKPKHDEEKPEEQENELENILRQQKIESITQNSVSGNSPTDKQKTDIATYIQQDGLVHKFATELGNYTNVTSQMNRLNVDYIRAMDVSSLDSKNELHRVDRLNNSSAGKMLASQHGVMHASRKSLKRQGKIHKLSIQDAWI